MVNDSTKRIISKIDCFLNIDGIRIDDKKIDEFVEEIKNEINNNSKINIEEIKNKVVEYKKNSENTFNTIIKIKTKVKNRYLKLLFGGYKSVVSVLLLILSYVGIVKIDKKFFTYCILGGLIIAFIFSLIGFYFGQKQSEKNMEKYIKICNKLLNVLK